MGLQALLNKLQLRENMTKTKRWHYRTQTIQIVHVPQQSSFLFHLLPSTRRYIHCPLPNCFNCREKGGDYRNLCTLLLADRIEFQLAGPSCEQLFTHRRERERLMSSGLAEKRTKEGLSRVDAPSALLPHCTWGGGYFFSFDHSLFIFKLLSVIVRESPIICGNCIHSIPCGKGSCR